MSDLFAKCSAFDFTRELEASGAWPYFLPFDASEGPQVMYRGRRLVMAGSNNYLGLATDPRVEQAAVAAIGEFGTSCTGSRLLNGTLRLHVELERELAAYVDKPAALVFSTGFQVNLGVISALVGEDDVVVIDRESHASIYDGRALASGARRRFRHGDADHLSQVLKSTPARKGTLVVVDGVYSMSGDIAPLPDLVRVCREHGARLMVDDAHGLGVLGGGRGTAAHFGVTDQVDLIMGTFSKSLASIGGFIAGPEEVIHHLKHCARSFIFSASISPPNAAAALAALRILRAEPERVGRLTANADRMRDELRALGFEIGATRTPIIPIMMRDESEALAAWHAVLDADVYVNCVVPPAAPADGCCLRSSYMATHESQHLDRVVEAFRMLRRERALPAAAGCRNDGDDDEDGAPRVVRPEELAAAGVEPAEPPQRLIEQMLAAVDQISDYTCIFTKQEYVDGTLLPTETIYVKQSRAQNAVYLRWLAEPFRDREIIWAPDLYGRKMKVHDGGFRARLGTVSIDPSDRFARRGNRHLVSDMGIFHTAEVIRAAFERGRTVGAPLECVQRPNELVHRQPSICVMVLDPTNEARATVEIAVHTDLWLPTRIRIWERSGRLTECHTFRDYDVEANFPERDFDVTSAEYGFARGANRRTA